MFIKYEGKVKFIRLIEEETIAYAMGREIVS
jgi:hypothetical protein